MSREPQATDLDTRTKDVDRPIDELELKQRSYNCLKRSGIHTIDQLVALTPADLLDIRSLGQLSLREIRDALGRLGLKLSGDGAA